jgi:hypothetical protein
MIYLRGLVRRLGFQCSVVRHLVELMGDIKERCTWAASVRGALQCMRFCCSGSVKTWSGRECRLGVVGCEVLLQAAWDICCFENATLRNDAMPLAAATSLQPAVHLVLCSMFKTCSSTPGAVQVEGTCYAGALSSRLI